MVSRANPSSISYKSTMVEGLKTNQLHDGLFALSSNIDALFKTIKVEFSAIRQQLNQLQTGNIDV